MSDKNNFDDWFESFNSRVKGGRLTVDNIWKHEEGTRRFYMFRAIFVSDAGIEYYIGYSKSSEEIQKDCEKWLTDPANSEFLATRLKTKERKLPMNNQHCHVCMSPTEPCHDCRVKSMQTRKFHSLQEFLEDFNKKLPEGFEIVVVGSNNDHSLQVGLKWNAEKPAQLLFLAMTHQEIRQRLDDMVTRAKTIERNFWLDSCIFNAQIEEKGK